MIRISALIVIEISALFSLVKQFQMLQQNSYCPSRYFKWLTGNFAPQLALCSAAFCLYSLCFSVSAFNLQLIFAVIFGAVAVISCIKSAKKSVKPLVFTKRVIRLFVCAAVILAILDCLYFLFSEKLAGEIFYVCALCLAAVSPLLCLAAWVFTLPIEKIFSAYYVHDAKKILSGLPRLKVIGITGSYGKTTTKFILNRILSEKYNTVCTPQSFNTPMGVVRTVREALNPTTEVFICEMGAKNKGDVKEICDIVSPDFGIITSVGPQHLDTFKSIENVFATKFELADAVAKKGGTVLANLDSDGIKTFCDTKDNVIYFGSSTDYRIENIQSGAAGSTFTLVLKDTAVSLSTKLLGIHSLSDILAAATLAYLLGVSTKDIAFAVSSLKPTEHRLQLKPFINGSLVIDDAYNSNPEGCLEVIRVLGSFEGYEKTVITPGLIELGAKEYECNYALGEQMTKYADKIILVGKLRAKPMLDAIAKTDFDTKKVFVVSSFKEGLAEFSQSADQKSVLLIENDLPDNYLS